MKRTLIVVLLLVLSLSIIADATAKTKKPKKPLKPPCAANIGVCPDQGCGTKFDPNLNKLKNIRADDPRANQPPTTHTLTWMKRLDDPEAFTAGESRDELTDLGEGQTVAVVGYLLVAKAELSGESCNCGLHTKEETDNHLVLVTKTTVDKFPTSGNAAAQKAIFHSRELESETAEFTPRVREPNHPNFTRERLQPLINATTQKALLVRVTGLLLFDSEHFIRNHLVRVNNWEIHPVLKLEFCTTGNNCKAKSSDGWKSLDALP